MYDTPCLQFQVGDTREAFASPVLVPRPGTNPQGMVVYNNGFEQAFASHKVQIDQLVTARRAAQTPKLTPKHPCIMGCLPDNVPAFPFNGEYEPKLELFKPINCPSLVVTKRVMVQDLNLISNPVRAHPLVFRVFAGRVAVIIIDPDTFLEQVDLLAWLKNPDPKALQNFPGQILESGDSVFVPLGHVPLWMGLCEALNITSPKIALAARGKQSQGPRKPEAFDEYVTVVLEPVYEPDQLVHVGVDMKTRIYQNYVGSKCFIEQISSAQGFDEYIAKCAPAKVAKPATVTA